MGYTAKPGSFQTQSLAATMVASILSGDRARLEPTRLGHRVVLSSDNKS